MGAFLSMTNVLPCSMGEPPNIPTVRKQMLDWPTCRCWSSMHTAYVPSRLGRQYEQISVCLLLTQSSTSRCRWLYALSKLAAYFWPRSAAAHCRNHHNDASLQRVMEGICSAGGSGAKKSSSSSHNARGAASRAGDAAAKANPASSSLKANKKVR